MQFARANGKMQVGKFSHADKETGEVREFKSCIFTNPETDELKFVAFSSKLGELTPKEIAEQKDDLQVVTLESGSNILCRKGQNAWEDVDLAV